MMNKRKNSVSIVLTFEANDNKDIGEITNYSYIIVHPDGLYERRINRGTIKEASDDIAKRTLEAIVGCFEATKGNY